MVDQLYVKLVMQPSADLVELSKVFEKANARRNPLAVVDTIRTYGPYHQLIEFFREIDGTYPEFELGFLIAGSSCLVRALGDLVCCRTKCLTEVRGLVSADLVIAQPVQWHAALDKITASVDQVIGGEVILDAISRVCNTIDLMGYKPVATKNTLRIGRR